MNRGFTLIELMVIVAIIGVLASVALPFYQGYIVKSQVNRAVSELSGYKSSFELNVNQGGNVTNADLGYVPSDLTLASSGVNIAVLNSDGSGHLEVTMGGNAHPSMQGLVIKLTRGVDGTWQCSLDNSLVAGNWQPAYLPKGCSI